MTHRKAHHGDVWRAKNGHVMLMLLRDTIASDYDVLMAHARGMHPRESIRWRVCEEHERVATIDNGEELCEFLGSVTAHEYMVHWYTTRTFISGEGSGVTISVTMTWGPP